MDLIASLAPRSRVSLFSCALCAVAVDCNHMDTCRHLAWDMLAASWQAFFSLSVTEPAVIDSQERPSDFPFQAECQILTGHKCLCWKKNKAQSCQL